MQEPYLEIPGSSEYEMEQHEKQEHYLNCDKCGETCRDDHGFAIEGETTDCVRSEAEDEDKP